MLKVRVLPAEHWQDQHGNELETCIIVTTAANDVMRPLHGRMPVIVDPGRVAVWMQASSPEDALSAVLAAADAPTLAMHPVSPRVNRPTVDDLQW